MLESLIAFSIRHRFLVMLAALALAALGAYNFQRLPIDAVPDITNVQVQINTEAAGFSPLEVEQRVTLPLELELSGLPRLEYYRSLSRYGLSQITVVFAEGTDLYLARQLVGERLAQARGRVPAQLSPTLAPIATGPFYAVRVVPGDIGTFAGLKTDEHARVIGPDNTPLKGLYAVGNDMASVLGGNYSGGGITLGPGMTFGYIAGLHAASERN